MNDLALENIQLPFGLLPLIGSFEWLVELEDCVDEEETSLVVALVLEVVVDELDELELIPVLSLEDADDPLVGALETLKWLTGVSGPSVRSLVAGIGGAVSVPGALSNISFENDLQLLGP